MNEFVNPWTRVFLQTFQWCWLLSYLQLGRILVNFTCFYCEILSSGSCAGRKVKKITIFKQVVPNLFGTRDQSLGRQLFHGPVGGMVLGWFKCITFIVHLASLTITQWYIMKYEMILQLTITQNQWESWAYFPATTQLYLGVMEHSGSQSLVLASLPQLHLRLPGIRFL